MIMVSSAIMNVMGCPAASAIPLESSVNQTSGFCMLISFPVPDVINSAKYYERARQLA
jgi:hypothetical protein